MSKRRPILLVAGSLLLVGGLLVRWITHGRREAPVALFFVGYTNKTVPVRRANGTLPEGGIVISPINISMAGLAATNQGLVPVQLWAGIRPSSLTREGFMPVDGSGWPRLLRPGESVTFEVWPLDPGAGWWTEVAYQRRGLPERIYGWAWDLGNSDRQMTMSRLLGAPAVMWVESGWITNRPPPIQRLPYNPPVTSRYHITAPPQGGPVELD